MTSRHYPSRPFLAVSLAVLRGDRLLVARRTQNPGAGVYSFPGGGVELGETLHEAALRELHEETRVSAAVLGLAGTREIIQRDEEGRVERHFVLLCFAARWLSGEGEATDEADDPRWVSLPELKRLPTTPGLADMAAKALAFAADAADKSP